MNQNYSLIREDVQKEKENKIELGKKLHKLEQERKKGQESDLRWIGGNRISQSLNTSEESPLIQQISVVELKLHVRLDLGAGDTVMSKAQQLCSQSSQSAKGCW